MKNELGVLEFIHALVETLDKYFESVCELDIMFNLEKAHFILEEMVSCARRGRGGGKGGWGHYSHSSLRCIPSPPTTTITFWCWIPTKLTPLP